MADILDHFLDMTPDPRSSSRWLLVEKPSLIYAIVAVYVLFVKKIGPALMKNRKGFELKWVLITYNIFQIVFNSYLCLQGVKLYITDRQWKGKCLQLNETRPEAVNLHLDLNYQYCLLRVIDLLDTVLFVLRKRYNQVTFLHFYHHILMAMFPFTIFRYQSNSHLALIGLVNSGVHVIMYFYYLLSSIRVDDKNTIWWKKYITLLQIGQFVFLFFALGYPIIHGEDCGYPWNLVKFAFIQNFLMIILFSKFYINSYIVKPKLKSKVE